MATDRLTQLQDLVHNLEELYSISLDELRNPARAAAAAAAAAAQQTSGFEGAPGEPAPTAPSIPDDAGKLFSRLIVQRAKAIDQFIGFLPTADLSESMQRSQLAELHTTNTAAREALEAAIADGEALLTKVRASLRSVVSGHYRLVTEDGPATAPAALEEAAAPGGDGAGGGAAADDPVARPPKRLRTD
mmetsp:Transcript_422/g.1195  ORF Transcript_422/g.1195 Transcript_422/m.1195 type:complete len:189 (-) Transcript_422:692-1258(-)